MLLQIARWLDVVIFKQLLLVQIPDSSPDFDEHILAAFSYLKVWYTACLWSWLQSCRSMRRL